MDHGGELPDPTMWPDFQSDARHIDTGPAPRRNTEGGIQPADKSLINRRLKVPSPALCRFLYQNKGFDLLDRSKWRLLLNQRFFLLTTDIRGRVLPSRISFGRPFASAETGLQQSSPLQNRRTATDLNRDQGLKVGGESLLKSLCTALSRP